MGKYNNNRDMMNWSKYQDQQLSVLQQLDRSFSSSLDTSQRISDNLNRIRSSMESMIRATKNMPRDDYRGRSSGSATVISEETIRNFQHGMNSMNQHISSMNSTIQDYIQAENDRISRMEKENEEAREKEERDKEYEGRKETASKKLNIFIKGLQLASEALNKVAKVADPLSDASNQMIKISGLNGDVVRGFRSDISDIVSQLNRETGNYYNTITAYKSIVDASQGVTSDTKALQTMARPLLLAQETLDLNMTDLSSLLNKFYVRYSFSSNSMENLVDQIRSNTAGNSATAQATMENIKSLEGWVSRYSGGSESEISRMTEEISKYTSWLESMNIDSAHYTEKIDSIAWGDAYKDRGIRLALDAAGSSVEEAQELLKKSGGLEKVTEILARGEALLYDRAEKSGDLPGIVLDIYGIDRKSAQNAANAFDSEGYISLTDFEKSIDNLSATDIVESKYVSAADNVNNYLSKIYDELATLQEITGIGWSDAASFFSLVATVLGTKFISNKITGALKNGAGGAGGAVGAGAGSGVKLATVGRVGGGAALIGAGIGVGAYGISEGASNIEEGDKGVGATQIAGGVTAGAGLVTLGGLAIANIWNPVGWVALAATILGGAALLGATIYDAATTIGTAEAIEKAYEDASIAIRKSAKKEEIALLDIQHQLETSSDLEDVRQELINTGILSEYDRNELLENWSTSAETNREALQELTKAYLEATGKWSEAADGALTKYKKEDTEYGYNIHGGTEEIIQDWLDLETGGNRVSPLGDARLKATEDYLYTIYDGLLEKDPSTFDKKTQKTFDNLAEIFRDSKVTSWDEVNTVLDEGAWNSVFQNSTFGPELATRAYRAFVESLEREYESVDKTSYGAQRNVTKDLAEVKAVEENAGTYHGYYEDPLAFELMAKALHARNEASAIEYLDQLRSAGYTTAKYELMKEAADTWKLEGYALGTNYITHDQLAIVHEGESITPKRYNPAANMNELETLRSESEKNRKRESEDSRRNQETMVEVMTEIREFLAAWKESNDKKETIANMKNRSRSYNNPALSYGVIV